MISGLRRAEATPDYFPSTFNFSSAVRGCDGGDRCGDLVMHQYLPDGTLALIVVDVAGRGSACASLASLVATNLLALLACGCGLDRAMNIAEYDVSCDDSLDVGQFVVVFTAVLDPNNGRMHYISAGHETALVLLPDRGHYHLKTTGPAFGILPAPRYRSSVVQFAAGDDLIVVTDGITDARNQRGIPFGSSGVVRAAQQATVVGNDPAKALIDASSRYGTSHPDDQAAVIVSCARWS